MSFIPLPYSAIKIPFYVFQKRNCSATVPSFHIFVSVCDLYVPRVGPHIFLLQHRQTNCGKNKSLIDTWMSKLGKRLCNSFSGNFFLLQIFGIYLCCVWNMTDMTSLLKVLVFRLLLKPVIKAISLWPLAYLSLTSKVVFINELIKFVELHQNSNPLNKKKSREKGLINIIDFTKCLFHP